MIYMIDRKLYEIIKQTFGESMIKDYPKDLASRIIVQKALYLLTHGISTSKLDLKYKWDFYLYGPYSSEISQMIYHMNDVWGEISTKIVHLTIKDLDCIKNFNDFINDVKNIKENEKEIKKLTDAELFELFGTIIYFVRQLGDIHTEIRNKLEEFKPDLIQKLPPNAFSKIYSLLNSYSYI